jgi:hypothetical protein
MTRDDIIRMAREAGEAEGLETVVFHPVLERFAALVAAAEREACAKVCEQERRKGYDDDADGALERVATIIRARSNT